VGEVVLAQDAGVLVRVAEAQKVQLDELEQLVETRDVPEQAHAVTRRWLYA
jgi:hypothetical protein